MFSRVGSPRVHRHFGLVVVGKSNCKSRGCRTCHSSKTLSKVVGNGEMSHWTLSGKVMLQTCLATICIGNGYAIYSCFKSRCRFCCLGISIIPQVVVRIIRCSEFGSARCYYCNNAIRLTFASFGNWRTYTNLQCIRFVNSHSSSAQASVAVPYRYGICTLGNARIVCHLSLIASRCMTVRA